MCKAKSILITGASGFIGSFLTEKALAKGYDTWAGIRKSSSREFLQDEQIRFIDLCFADKEKLTEQLSVFAKEHGKFDYIIHNAGVTKCLDQQDFERINYGNTVNFVEALREADCIPEKFIFMSSLSVMGKGDEKSYTPFATTDTPHPDTAYGKSKWQAEEYIRSQENVPYLIFRPTGVYGPREKDYLLMLKTIQSGLNAGAGFRAQHLTFIYVKDLADIIFDAIESPIKDKTYFVADGDVHTDSEYTQIAKEVLGKKRTINIKIPLWLLKGVSVAAELLAKATGKPSTLNRDKYKIMSQRNWECDIAPLKEDFNFSPRYNLRKGLEESVKWYRKKRWIK
ncbi:NAD(P)-dependent oxidoreductase [Dysgonomonas sp. 25]|uniref:NAD-dependent epimerase/dehydratase family protein n=1 Tax=Dysgonomonas sp. 25 TaxID=2302933 RepID=UPI0013D81622|nr:NAD(P)-dependent oxidoreductase [Dysgonomonas sp. 25]NDV69130.1 NAD(P)-dependent oxidoreductase [Dysgonomonas sp. 25]